MKVEPSGAVGLNLSKEMEFKARLRVLREKKKRLLVTRLRLEG